MSPQIALLLCIFFIFSLFIISNRHQLRFPAPLWIPLIWVLIMASRPVSLWLNLGISSVSREAYLEGSPFDRTIYIIIIAIGLLILTRRKIAWANFLQANKWIIFLYIYCGISILWSDYQYTSLKRLIKDCGNLVMILVILSEPDPLEALRLIMRRCAYVLIPLSILLINYYPSLGRDYHIHTGEMMVLGVTTHKNALGGLCFISFLFLFSNLHTMLHNRTTSLDKKDVFVHVILLLLISWLLKLSNSVTPLLCLILSTSLFILIGLPIIRRNIKYVGIYAFIFVLCFIILQYVFNLAEVIIAGVGRDITLTGRTQVWHELINIGTDPLIGTGYDSFWLADISAKFQEKWHLNQAHNGYLEIYLNLGFIGLFFLTNVIVSAYRKSKLELISRFENGRFMTAFLFTVLTYNITEGIFMGLSLVWFCFLFIALTYPK